MKKTDFFLILFIYILSGLQTTTAEVNKRKFKAACTPDLTLKGSGNTALKSISPAGIWNSKCAGSEAGDDTMFAVAGQPADISSSAYQYRSDRKKEENPPESWFALMRFAGMPFNKPVDVNSSAIKQVLCGLLWEEIRPVKTLELTWGSDAKHQPSPDTLLITTLDRKGNASSWWNNLIPEEKKIKPVISKDGRSYIYSLDSDINGIIVSLVNKNSNEYDVPNLRTLTSALWKKMDIEVEWGFESATSGKDYSGRIETYDGVATRLLPLKEDVRTKAVDSVSWRSSGKGTARRGIRFGLFYIGTSQWRKIQPYTSQEEDVARTIVTLWTKAGNFSFLAADLENGPIYAPEYGVFIRRSSQLAFPAAIVQDAPFTMASQATSATEFIKEHKKRNLSTVRQKIRNHSEQTWEGAMEGIKHCKADTLPPHPKAPAGFEPPMQVNVPSERLTAQWNLEAWHLLRHCEKNPKTGRLWFNDYPYGILAAETYIMLEALDMMGYHQAASDGYDQWVSLPMQPRIEPGHAAKPGKWQPEKQTPGSLLDRPTGNFSDGLGCLTLAEGVPGVGGHMDGVHAYGPGCIGWSLTEHFRLTNDVQWLKDNLERIKANAEWMLRQRRLLASMVPGGERLWCKGLQPAHQATPDSGGEFMEWYWSESFYYASVARLANILKEIDPQAGSKLIDDANAYRRDLLAAVERSITLSPMVQTRDGVFHSVIPFACYMRGLGTGAWGWQRKGSEGHWGPLTFETDLSATPLITVAEILPVKDPRVQGYLDVLEDRLLIDNPRTGALSWFYTGWQHQVGIQKTIEAHLIGDDIPVFIRSFLNSYAIHIDPNEGYVFNEHVFRGPPDKIFEDGAFVVRFRNLLVMEEGQNLWLARATPKTWLEQGKKISVRNSPTYFGTVSYDILSDVDHGRINATVEMPSRNTEKEVWLRLRHPGSKKIRKVSVNGRDWKNFDQDKEIVELKGLTGTVSVSVRY